VLIWGITPELQGFQETTWPLWARAFWNSLSRPFYSFFFFLVFAGAVTGKHRVMRWMLTNPLMDAWAKVSFMTYLL